MTKDGTKVVSRIDEMEKIIDKMTDIHIAWGNKSSAKYEKLLKDEVQYLVCGC